MQFVRQRVPSCWRSHTPKARRPDGCPSCCPINSVKARCNYLQHTQPLHFNRHILSGPGLANTTMSPFWILLELRMMAVLATTGAIRHAKLQSTCHHHHSNRPDALQVVQTTMSEHSTTQRDVHRLESDKLSEQNE